MDNKLLISLLLVLCVGIAHASLVAEYTMQGNETTVTDMTGNGNNCTINNASYVAGVIGNGMSFNGFDSYLDCGNDSSLNFGTGDFTLMAWIKNPSTYIENFEGGYNVEIIYKEGFSGVFYELAIANSTPDGNTNQLYGQTDDGVNNGYVAYDKEDGSKTENLFDGNWHHVVLTRDDNVLYLYYNGEFILSEAEDNPVDTTDNIGDLFIGMIDDDYYFNGIMDEVKIYNEALSPTFIAEVYEDEKPHVAYTILDLPFMVFDVIGNVLQGLITNIPSLINTILYLFMFGILFSAIGVIFMLITRMKPKI